MLEKDNKKAKNLLQELEIEFRKEGKWDLADKILELL